MFAPVGNDKFSAANCKSRTLIGFTTRGIVFKNSFVVAKNGLFIVK